MSDVSPTLAKVARGALCAGCGGCALVAPEAITMELSGHGFLRPRQHGQVPADAEARIAAICPGVGQTVDVQERPDDALWGPVLEMRQGWATDPAMRHAASSGGALSAVLAHLIESGVVDSVVQTAAAQTPPTGNAAVVSMTRQDVLQAAGSRYAPSSPLADLSALLDGQKRHAFVGKPCDVAALRALALHDPRVNARIPVMMSFFCAGVPSLKGAAAVLDALEAPRDDVTAFRYRGQGWPGFATATLRDGTTRQMSYHDSWGKILSKHVQHRCKVCADGVGMAADIVCADAWETDTRGYPLFEEQDGISLMVVRTKTGRDLMRAAETAGRLATADFDSTGLAEIQPGQSGRKRALVARLAGLRLMGLPTPRYRGLHLRAAALQNRLPVNFKNFLGMIRRGLQGKIKET
ncbi:MULTISPECIES: Coenzyme F420 hydrogenase/dehydrogenase, beta subunit C-terminal domain [Rhodobacterales]|uniref:Coenzyme F420 hydrogenase/dehydrogenase, beta subunit C-terminal domain n=1 Tax=Rhodobacterales TaxID=204455 RepID=UPI0032987324